MVLETPESAQKGNMGKKGTNQELGERGFRDRDFDLEGYRQTEPFEDDDSRLSGEREGHHSVIASLRKTDRTGWKGGLGNNPW